MLQDKYKINIYVQGEYPHDPGGRNICQLKEYLEKLCVNVNMFFKDQLPRYLHIEFASFSVEKNRSSLQLQEHLISLLPELAKEACSCFDACVSIVD